MAKDGATRAKARAAFESGKSARSICATMGLARNTLAAWITSGGWVAGKNAPKLIQKEEKALEVAAARLGLDKAKVTAKIAQRLNAKMAVRITDSGSFSTCPLPPDFETGPDGKTMFGGETLTVTDDAGTQGKALDQAIAVLGMAKVQVDPSDEFRAFFGSLKGGAK